MMKPIYFLIILSAIGCKDQSTETTLSKQIVFVTDKLAYYYTDSINHENIKLTLFNGTDSTIVHWYPITTVWYKDSTDEWTWAYSVDGWPRGPILSGRSMQTTPILFWEGLANIRWGFYKITCVIYFDTILTATNYRELQSNEFQLINKKRHSLAK
jgi:hypothetical protein